MKKKIKEIYKQNPIPELISDEAFFVMQKYYLVDSDWLKKYMIKRERKFLEFEKKMKISDIYFYLSKKWGLSVWTISNYCNNYENMVIKCKSFFENTCKKSRDEILKFAMKLKTLNHTN